jgi:phage gp29-like protein
MLTKLTGWAKVPALFSRRKPEMNELAAADRFAGALGRAASYNADDLVSTRGFEIYDRMQRDAQVAACLNVKKFAVLSRGWQVHPAGQSPEALRAAEFVRFCLEDMRGSVLDALYKTLDAVAKGFSVLEINYKIIEGGRFGGMIGLASIKSKDPSQFKFQVDEFLNVRGLTTSPSPSLSRRGDRSSPLSKGGLRGVDALPPEKFIVYTYMPRYESPYGMSDLRAAYKHWWSKDIILRFFNVYLEKYGSPTAMGSYQRGMPKSQQDELLKVLDKIQQETAIVIPEDVKIQLLEAQRGGEAGYLEALAYHDKQIAKAILGQTLTTDEGLRYGSFALAKVHLDVLRMHLEKLKRDLEETVMREQLIRRLMEYNFGSAEHCPRFSLGTLEQRDLAVVGDLVTRLITGGVIAPDETWIREYLGLPEKAI